MPYSCPVSEKSNDGGAQQGVADGKLQAVDRLEFPNRCSFATILIRTFPGKALGCCCNDFQYHWKFGGARNVKLSDTRFVLGCRGEHGIDRVSAADGSPLSGRYTLLFSYGRV